ncbi:MAG: hypothetical protein AMJ45_06460 [Syntrophobacter sp. DG_60]|nr:MAG: hypothetical protein AMJ45_06460 [Syntrophobacter sp. DG_60]
MPTFFMFGKYSSEAVKEISAERTRKVINLVEKLGGKVNSMYALLGEYDLVFIVDFPGTQEAMKASVGLTKLTGISFSTSPAVTVEHFDKMIAEM